MGLLSKKQYEIFSSYRDSVNKIKKYCENTCINSNKRYITLSDYIKRPEKKLSNKNVFLPAFNKYSKEALFTAETDMKYDGYVKIENRRVAKIKALEKTLIPPQFKYASLPGLSSESVEKLIRIQPETLGQASRLAGVRPSDVGVLAIYLQSHK